MEDDRIIELMAAVHDNKPTVAADLFSQILHDKALERIEAKREEIAATYFGQPEEDEGEDFGEDAED